MLASNVLRTHSETVFNSLNASDEGGLARLVE
jgi:hypothetical protein